MNLKEEKEWRCLPDVPGYSISESGDIYSSISNKTMKPFQMRGYLRVALNGGKKKLFIHRLVCAAFNGGDLYSKLSVDHIDMNSLNNHYSNLRWMPHGDNARIGQANRKYKHKGVTIENGRFRTRLYVERVPYHIGNYQTFDEAMANYRLNYLEWFGKLPNEGEG